MATRDPLTRVRDAVHRVTERRAPARTTEPAVRPRGGASADPCEEVDPDRCEELRAMRAAAERAGDTPADRATATATAYLAARRRRLKRQLDAS